MYRHTNISMSCHADFFNCSAKVLNNKISLTIDFFRDVSQINLILELYVRPYKLGNYNLIRKLNLDVCKLMVNSKEDAYLYSVFEKMVSGKKNHFMKHCPIAKVCTYIYIVNIPVRILILLSCARRDCTTSMTTRLKTKIYRQCQEHKFISFLNITSTNRIELKRSNLLALAKS